MRHAQHWERLYSERDPHEVSWYEAVPEASMALIAEAAVPQHASIIDVGGGTSRLAVLLIAAGYRDVTVADISSAALEHARHEAGKASGQIEWVEADVRSCDFGRRFDLWHDRAVFHFMVADDDRDGYLQVLRRSLKAGGHLLLATFGPGGPIECSGLPVARYSARELLTALGSEFDLVSSRIDQHRTPSGRPQEFVYSHFRRRAA